MASPEQPSSGNETPEEKIEKLEKEVAALKTGLDVLTRSIYDFTRMLFKSGGKDLDAGPKRKVISSLGHTMQDIRDQLGLGPLDVDRRPDK